MQRVLAPARAIHDGTHKTGTPRNTLSGNLSEGVTEPARSVLDRGSKLHTRGDTKDGGESQRACSPLIEQEVGVLDVVFPKRTLPSVLVHLLPSNDSDSDKEDGNDMTHDMASMWLFHDGAAWACGRWYQTNSLQTSHRAHHVPHKPTSLAPYHRRHGSGTHFLEPVPVALLPSPNFACCKPLQPLGFKLS